MPHTDIEDVFEFDFIRNNSMEDLCPIVVRIGVFPIFLLHQKLEYLLLVVLG
jgi:hypothetical protein